MLKKRIICTLLWGEHGLVKPRAFGEPRARGSMMDAVRVMNRRNIDELIILDITDKAPRFEEIKEFTHVFCPVTVGGGVRSVEDAVRLLEAGADKVAIRTALSAIPDISKKLGCQSVVGVIDAGRSEFDNLLAAPLARKMEALGAGEILVTSVPRDGTMEGYDLNLISYISSAVTVPVIANGGCSSYADMKAAFDAGADAVAAGALWLYTEATPKEAARYLHSQGIPTRLT